MASRDTLVGRVWVSARGRGGVVFAFAFAVMAYPVSSVACAIEAAPRALGGHLELLTACAATLTDDERRLLQPLPGSDRRGRPCPLRNLYAAAPDLYAGFTRGGSGLQACMSSSRRDGRASLRDQADAARSP